ncbi:MAG: YihY family inner membrane protein [Candidatus Hydrogenedentes bacterium]|nr:YihY family inner membrane protein [Candidatus Hydrogenedentota bacterium]
MRDLFQRTIEALQRGKRFVTRDVWRIGRPGEEVPHGFVIKHIRVAILLLKGVVQDDLLLRASALTFATTLALVPFLAIMFLVIQTFHLDENLYLYLTDHLLSITGRTGASAAVDHKDLLQQILQLVMQNVAQSPQTSDGKLLENPVKMMVTYAKEGANPSALGWAGVLFVVATVFGLMMNIESSFNQIWGVKRFRSWYRLLSDYLTILFLLPFLLVGALSLTFAIRLIEDQGSLAFALRGVQYAVIWLVFTGIYMLMPNTKVKFRYAFLGGVVAGTLWSLAAWGYVQFQFGLPRYSLLYSAFAQFPVLLLWLYVSWLILLLGAELAFAYQNEKTFAMERLAEGASHAYREAVGLRVMLELSRRFDQGLPALTPVESAEAWNVPLRLVNETLEILETTGLVVRAAGEPQRYQPARSTERISVGDVVTAVRESGNEPSLLRQDEELLPLFRDLNESHGLHLSRSMAEMARRLRGDSESEPRPTRP